MSQNGGEWPDEPGGYARDAESQGAMSSRGFLPTVLAWLLALVAIGWIAICIWYIHRAIGWQSVPQLLPYEMGALIAGALAPPAVLFALAAWTVRD